MSVVLPKVFEEAAEDSKFLVRVKRRATKNFKWTHRICLENVLFLAQWLYIFDRVEEALEVSRFLGQAQFDGNLDHWIWIQSSLTLQSRILTTLGLVQEANDCLSRVRSVGDNTYRLDGMVLHLHERDVNNALDLAARGSTRLGKLCETVGRMMAVMELFFLVEMASSPALPTAVLEEKLAIHIERLKQLAKK